MAAYQSSEQDLESDKTAKKQFKKTVQAMEIVGGLSLNEDGIVTLLVKEKKKKEKKHKDKKKKDKKRKMEQDEANDGEEGDTLASEQDESKRAKVEQGETEDNGNDVADKNKPCKGNPSGCTRIFIGNLPFAVDDAALAAHLPGELTHVKWISDKETGRFYGSAFVEMKNSRDAAEAVRISGSQLMGRPLKINFAPARPGDVWPPKSNVVTGGQAGGKGVASMSEKPEGCTKLFIGNLSYEIDDDAIYKFFSAVDAEVKAVRWLSHQETGDFKGCGFVEFWTTEACDKGATLNGKNLLGRPIRIDWTD